MRERLVVLIPSPAVPYHAGDTCGHVSVSVAGAGEAPPLLSPARACLARVRTWEAVGGATTWLWLWEAWAGHSPLSCFRVFWAPPQGMEPGKGFQLQAKQSRTVFWARTRVPNTTQRPSRCPGVPGIAEPRLRSALTPPRRLFRATVPLSGVSYIFLHRRERRSSSWLQGLVLTDHRGADGCGGPSAVCLCRSCISSALVPPPTHTHTG